MGAHQLLETKNYQQGRLSFTLTQDKIIVRTSHQTFFLLPKQSYYYKRLNTIRAMIMIGEIRDLNELAAFCKNSIEWRVTSLPIDVLIYTGSKP